MNLAHSFRLDLISRRFLAGLGTLLCLLGTDATAIAGPGSSLGDGEEFFEAKIRPVLVKHCYSCHSAEAKKLKGGLRLDSASDMRRGGESGSAVVPGNVAESLIVSALRQETTQMPPSGKLPDEVIADFVKWVEMGAPDPRNEPVAATSPAKSIDLASARRFWSFRPPVKAPLPEVSNPAWVKSPIDRFVLAKLDEKGLKPVPAATKRELIRRATFDLIGLPPSPQEIESFLEDQSPDAFGKVVDRLLASPHYGERWGRYWLDVARYAEDQAHTFAVEPNTSAFRYRDWVVQAFNRDLPYDQFVKLQIAGDQMIEGQNPPFEGRVALGFFGLGAQYYKNTDAAKAAADELDDRVDTLTRGFLGLTVSCARCHDHKFDPIPTQDYYSLAGVFQSSRLANTPLVNQDEVKRFNADQERLKTRDADLKVMRTQERAKLLKTQVESVNSSILASWKYWLKQRSGSQVSAADLAREEGLNPAMLERWIKLLDPNNPETAKHASLIAWRRLLSAKDVSKLEAVPDEILETAKQIRVELDKATTRPLASKATPIVDVEIDITKARRLYLIVGDGGDGMSCDWADWIEPRLIGPAGEKRLTDLAWKQATTGFGSVQVGHNAAGGPLRVAGQDVAFGIGTHAPSVIAFDLPPGYTRFVARGGIDNGGSDQGGGATVEFVATTRKPDSAGAALSAGPALNASSSPLAKLLIADSGILKVSDSELPKFLEPDRAGKLEEITAEVAKLKASTEKKYPLAHSLVEAETGDMKIFIRGNPAQQGEVAPRRFLRILAGENPPAFSHGSGRVDLANCVASADNPLTARVMINRIWQQHFGRGLVGTASNFGFTGEHPSHPELLDFLAISFVESGWSIKAMHRLIMQSATYQLSTQFNPKNAEIDGDNRFLWRASRRRLDVEAWRDSFLQVAGRLDLTLGGPSMDLASSSNTRRTLYGKISRHQLDSLLRFFDFPDPNITSDHRNETTVPQQQLFVINSPFVIDLSRSLARRLHEDCGKDADDAARIRFAYLLLFGRPAEEDEVRLGVAYLSRQDDPADKPGSSLTRWERFAQVLLSSNEFLYLD